MLVLFRANNSKPTVIHQTIKDLNAKDVFYVKFGKGNSMLILDDKSNKSEDGAYQIVIKNALNNLVQMAQEARMEILSFFGESLQWSHITSNHRIEFTFRKNI